MKKWIIIVTATASFVMAMLAFASPGRPRSMHRSGGHGPIRGLLRHPEMLEQLGVNAEQAETLRTWRYEVEKSHVALQAKIEQAELDVRHLLSKTEPNEEAIMDAINKAGEAKIALRKSQVRHLLKARSLLGTQTWNKVRKLMRSYKRRGPKHKRTGPDRETWRDDEHRRPGPWRRHGDTRTAPSQGDHPGDDISQRMRDNLDTINTDGDGAITLEELTQRMRQF